MVSEKQLLKLVRTKQNLENERSVFLSMWKDIALQMSSSYGNWCKESSTSSKVMDSVVETFDNTANDASNQMADGLMGSCFGRSIAWFCLKFEKEALNDDDVAALWLYEQEKFLYKQFDVSNFYDESRAFIRQGCDFGTSVMFCEESSEDKKPFFRTLHPKDVVVMENRFGVVDAIFRDIYLTKDDAVGQFGEDELPDAIRTCEDYTKKFVFHQYVGANYRFGLDVDGADAFVSVFWCDYDLKKTLKEERYLRKPFVCWRWNRDIEGSSYGTQCPGIMQRSNMKSVNVLAKNVLQQSQMIATPPIKKTKGLVINIKPRGITDLEANQDFAPVNVSGDLSFTQLEREYIRQSIRQSYYSDFFLFLSRNVDKSKTATEVAGILNEQANVMSSFFNRLATEFLEPVIEFVFENELEHGRLDALPLGLESIAEEGIEIDFVSSLFLTQKRSHSVDNLMQATNQIVSLAQVNNEVLDKIDFDSLSNSIADGWNVRKVLLRSEAEVNKIRQTRAQMQQAMLQQQQQQQALQSAGDAYGKLNKAPEQGSPMDFGAGLQKGEEG